MKNLLLIIISYLVGLNSLTGQEVKTEAMFLQDSMLIGQPVELSVVATYPEEVELLFPDSTYSFAPFDYVDKKFFPTKISDGLLKDSVVYTLRSFEIEKEQGIELPVFLVGKDSITFKSNYTAVLLQEEISQMSDSLRLKKELGFNSTRRDFNYPYFLIGLGILIVITLLVIIIFGKRIYRSFRIWRLKKKHTKFMEDFSLAITQVNENNAERLLFEWKKYLQSLSRLPYLSSTTAELQKLVAKQDMIDSLKIIDKSIYSSRKQPSLEEAFQQLHNYAEILFEERIESIKNNG